MPKRNSSHESWVDLTAWWLEEVTADGSYELVVTPLLLEVLQPEPEVTYLDLGSGEGRSMRAVGQRGAAAYGIELNEDLARLSGSSVAVAELPGIPIRDDAVGGAYCVLVLEHIRDYRTLFREAARVTKSKGILSLVANHPVWTAPDSTPITDSDGEVLWRPGEYFSTGSSSIPAGKASVDFHHRTLSDLLNAAAGSGWSLEKMVERPHHELEDQTEIPRLLACRWRLDG